MHLVRIWDYNAPQLPPVPLVVVTHVPCVWKRIHVQHVCFIYMDTSLGAYANCAKVVGVWGSVPLLPHLCPLSVPEVCGVYSESP